MARGVRVPNRRFSVKGEFGHRNPPRAGCFGKCRSRSKPPGPVRLYGKPEQSLAKSKRHGAKSTHFIVEVQKGNLVVSLPSGRFRAVYYKAAGRPHLILRERSKTDDHELLADAFQAAVAKARELGWIV
jgi:hypothetical protein